MSKSVTSRSADICMAEDTGDKFHSWTMYPIDKVEKALRKHGYILDTEHYKKFDADKEELIFTIPMYEQYAPDWDKLVFRLKIADRFYKVMKWCYYNFRPE